MKEYFQKKTLNERIKDLDVKLQSTDASKLFKGNKQFQSILGVRLALEMAREIQENIPVGSYSSKLILEWGKKYGSTEFVIRAAKEFLISPKFLKNSLEKKLFK